MFKLIVSTAHLKKKKKEKAHPETMQVI